MKATTTTLLFYLCLDGYSSTSSSPSPSRACPRTEARLADPASHTNTETAQQYTAGEPRNDMSLNSAVEPNVPSMDPFAQTGLLTATQGASYGKEAESTRFHRQQLNASVSCVLLHRFRVKQSDVFEKQDKRMYGGESKTHAFTKNDSLNEPICLATCVRPSDCIAGTAATIGCSLVSS